MALVIAVSASGLAPLGGFRPVKVTAPTSWVDGGVRQTLVSTHTSPEAQDSQNGVPGV